MSNYKFNQIVDRARASDCQVCKDLVAFESTKNKVWLVETDMKSWVVIAPTITSAKAHCGMSTTSWDRAVVTEVCTDNDEVIVMKKRIYDDEEIQS